MIDDCTGIQCLDAYHACRTINCGVCSTVSLLMAWHGAQMLSGLIVSAGLAPQFLGSCEQRECTARSHVLLSPSQEGGSHQAHNRACRDRATPTSDQECSRVIQLTSSSRFPPSLHCSAVLLPLLLPCPALPYAARPLPSPPIPYPPLPSPPLPPLPGSPSPGTSCTS